MEARAWTRLTFQEGTQFYTSADKETGRVQPPAHADWTESCPLLTKEYSVGCCLPPEPLEQPYTPPERAWHIYMLHGDSVFLYTEPTRLQCLEYQQSAVSMACFEPIAGLVYFMDTYEMSVLWTALSWPPSNGNILILTIYNITLGIKRNPSVCDWVGMG